MRETLSSLRARIDDLEAKVVARDMIIASKDESHRGRVSYLNQQRSAQEQAIRQKEDRIAQLARELAIRDARIQELEAEMGYLRLFCTAYWHVADHFYDHKRDSLCLTVRPLRRIWPWLKQELGTR